MTVGPSMNQERTFHGCGIYHSSGHSGRPAIVTAGSHYRDGKNSEIWDFTAPGSQWQLSKYLAGERSHVSQIMKMNSIRKDYNNN